MDVLDAISVTKQMFHVERAPGTFTNDKTISIYKMNCTNYVPQAQLHNCIMMVLCKFASTMRSLYGVCIFVILLSLLGTYILCAMLGVMEFV